MITTWVSSSKQKWRILLFNNKSERYTITNQFFRPLEWTNWSNRRKFQWKYNKQFWNNERWWEANNTGTAPFRTSQRRRKRIDNRPLSRIRSDILFRRRQIHFHQWNETLNSRPIYFQNHIGIHRFTKMKLNPKSPRCSKDVRCVR